MLFGDNSVQILRIPHKKEYEIWKGRLTTQEYQAIYKELQRILQTDRVQTSSWIPGSNWSHSVYQPIYEACGKDQESAAKFFGLIFYQVVMEDEGCWGMARGVHHDTPIKGLTYYKYDKDPRE